MASLQQEPTGVYHIVIRFDGRRYKRSLKTKFESVAIAKRDEIDETIKLLKRGKIVVPEGRSGIDFILGETEVVAPAPPPSEMKVDRPPRVTLISMFNQFFDAIPAGSLEDGTLKMLHIHERHFLRILKSQFEIATLTGQQLQEYVNARAKEKSQYFAKGNSGKPKDERERKKVSATTIRKEIVTLGSAWSWATTVPLVSGPFPNKGLRFPKTDEKPPFQTWDEIKRQAEVEFLDPEDANDLWECLYLRKLEIANLIEHVKKTASTPFVYPMFAMAAYTGARRAELMRSLRADFNFDQNFVTIRERKRVKGRRSTRRVPLTPLLREIMLDWFDNHHPGGPATFVYTNLDKVNKPAPITPDQAHSHFRAAVDGSHWERIKGWHCLRHSFISNLACAGVDQRIIDEFVGHSTDEMRRRYRHLFPDVKQAALNQVFG